MNPSHLEQKFIYLWEQANPDLLLERERLLIPKRKYRFDFVHTESKTAFEINGGTFSRKMGHSTGRGIRRDYEKLALAQLNGWRCFLLDSDMINLGWVRELGKYCRNQCRNYFPNL